MKINKFWICLVMGNKAPAGGFHHHGTFQDAKAEAERLIRIGEKSVIVFEATFAARPADTPVAWEILQVDASYLEDEPAPNVHQGT